MEQLQEKYQTFKRASTISVRPFTEFSNDNMGLEKYNMVLFEGAIHEESVAYIEINGNRIYKTGLNEFAQEVLDLPDDKREAKQKEIRTIVADLEKKIMSNVIDIKDKDFWNKVKVVRNDNYKLWDELLIRSGNNPVYLEPTKDPKDMLKLKAIEAGGYTTIAPSLEIAKKYAPKYKFYLDKYEETATIRTEVTKIRNKALSELEKLYNSNVTKMFYVAKLVDPNAAQYKKNTPNDIIYENLDKYINGELVERDKRKTAKHFIDYAELDIETLKIRALIQDASFYQMIRTKADGHIYHMKTNTMLGKNPSDCLEFLKNPLNEEILSDLTKNIEKIWNT